MTFAILDSTYGLNAPSQPSGAGTQSSPEASLASEAPTSDFGRMRVLQNIIEFPVPTAGIVLCVGAGRTNRDAGFILQCREITQRWLVLPRKVLSALESVLVHPGCPRGA
jgi:hypothetical protein